MSETSYKLQLKMVKLVTLAEKDFEPTVEERQFVEDTLKAILKDKKKEITEFEATYKKERSSPTYNAQQISEHLKQLKKNVLYFCVEAISILDKKLLPKAESAQGKVFFLKVKGDFLRYTAECLRKGDSYYKAVLQEGLKTYALGYEIAKDELSCEDSIYLSLCLNFSVFYYTVAGDILKACELISKTLKQLESARSSILEEIWKSIQPTMCLLKNNLTLWLSELEDEC